MQQVSKSPTLVKPLLSNETLVKLTVFDNLAPALPFHFQFAYRNEKSDPNFMNATELMSALEKTLSIFPIFAGRTVRNNEGEWFVDIRNETCGVPFTIAQANFNLDDFDKGDFDQYPKDLYTQWKGIQDAPLQIQVTYFKCGGVLLVSELLHQLGDGDSHAQFLHRWSQLFRGESIDNIRYDCLNRNEVIKVSNKESPKSFPLWTQSEEHINYEELYAKIGQCTAKMIKFSEKELQAMKKEAMSSIELSNANSWISTNDALCSHMWKLITKARNLSNSQTSCLLHSCNVRKPLNIQKDYFGYLVMNGQSDRISVESILHSNLSTLASVSRHAVNRTMDKQHVQDFIDWISGSKKVRPSDMHVLFGTDVFATSWVAFNLFDLKFSNESPIFVGEIPTILDGVFKIVEGVEKGSLVIQLSLWREHMESLLKDPELHKYQ